MSADIQFDLDAKALDRALAALNAANSIAGRFDDLRNTIEAAASAAMRAQDAVAQDAENVRVARELIDSLSKVVAENAIETRLNAQEFRNSVGQYLLEVGISYSDIGGLSAELSDKIPNSVFSNAISALESSLSRRLSDDDLRITALAQAITKLATDAELATFATTTSAALSRKLNIKEAQALTDEDRAIGRGNLGLGNAATRAVAGLAEAQGGEGEGLLSAAAGKAMLESRLANTALLPAGGSVPIDLATLLGGTLDGRAFGASPGGALDNSGALSSIAMSGRDVRLPEGDYLLSLAAVSKLSLAARSNLSIRGAGSGKTRLIISPLIEAGQMLALGALETTGPLSVQFPTPKGSTFDEERPTTFIAQTGTIGDFEIKVADASGIEVGDIVRIKSQRLDMRGETRNSNMRGETNRVKSKSGSTLMLEYPLADSYSPDIVWSGTATAGTNLSVTLATGLSTDLVNGCRVRITAGAGSGQTRYITEYDPTTGIAKIDGEPGTYAQSVFSPIPGGTSAVTVDRATYVFVTKSLDSFVMSGFTLVCTDKTPRGMTIFGAVRPHLEDIKVEGARGCAFGYYNCVDPTGRDLVAIDCNDTNLGYTVILSGCRNARFYGLSSINCRRGGVDCGGSTTTWGCHVSGVRVIGGQVDGSGVPWSPANPNFGAGEHGQAGNFTYEGLEIEGVQVGFVQRGNNTKVTGLRINGPVWRHIWLNAGSVFTLDGYDYDLRADNTVIPSPVVIGGEGHILFITGSKWVGDINISNVNIKGAQGSLIYVLVNSSRPATQRVKGGLRIRNYSIDWRTPSSVGLFDGSDNYAINGWDLDTPRFSISGGGTFTPNRKMYISTASAGQSVYYRIGDVWTVSVADDGVVALPSALRNAQVGVRIFSQSSNAALRVNGILRANSAVFASYATSSGTVTVSALSSTPNGISGTDGNLNLFHSGSELWIENRTGAELQASVILEGGL